MYIEIQHLKEKGFSNSKISKMLNISRPTVIKYINMSPDEFNLEMKSRNQRSKKPDIYHNDILAWLREYPEITAAQIYDWLEEKYKEVKFNEATTRNYVRWIRKEYNIPKGIETRQYGAPDDPPFGNQAQVDFGEIKVTTSTGSSIKLLVMCFVLSNSRYKYCEWQDRPFTTEDIIMDMNNDKELARYEIPSSKGNLLGNNNHKRDTSIKISALLSRTVELFIDKVQNFSIS